MARPITGSVEQVSPNSWQARVPDKHGTGEQMYRYFKTESVARVWIQGAIAEIRDGLPVSEPLAEQHWLDELSNYYVSINYRPKGNALPERTAEVERQLKRMVTFLKVRWATPEDVHFDGAQGLMQHLAGELDADGRPLTDTAAASVFALRETTQQEYLATLIALLDLAVARRTISFNPANTVRTQAPSAKAKTRRRKADSHPQGGRGTLTFAALRVVLGQMHVLHQMVALLQRVMGLRVSEVYGLRVRDVQDFGDYGVFWVKAQGGRNFLEWTDDGQVRKVRRTERTKTEESYRVQVVPPILMIAIRIIIRAFHTAPDGTVAVDHPLIPGIEKLEPSSATYQAAIDKAGLGEHLATSHDLRKDLCIDLSHKTKLSGSLQRLLVGHRAGKDVHATVYEGHSSELTPYLEAADQIEMMVRAEVDSLLTPTASFPGFYRNHPMYSERHRIRATLHEVGLDGLGFDELSVEEVADQINRAVTTTRRLIADGTIPGRKLKAPDGRSTWMVRQEEVNRFENRYAGTTLIDEIAARFGMTYHQMHALLASLGVGGVHDSITGRVLLDRACVDTVADEMTRREQLDLVSMRMDEAEQLLGRKRTTIRSWIDKGLVQVEPSASDNDGLRLTRASIGEHKERLDQGWRHGSVPTRR
jgi:integrase